MVIPACSAIPGRSPCPVTSGTRNSLKRAAAVTEKRRSVDGQEGRNQENADPDPTPREPRINFFPEMESACCWQSRMRGRKPDFLKGGAPKGSFMEMEAGRTEGTEFGEKRQRRQKQGSTHRGVAAGQSLQGRQETPQSF